MSAHETAGETTAGRLRRLLVYSVFFLSGAAALIYEISWSRQIGLLFGHTVHAATVVLASYFSGMAIGYWVGARWSARISPLKGYAVAELVVAIWAFIIPLLLSLSETTTFAPWLSSSSFAWQTAARVVFSFLLLLPGTIALGVTLPMIAAFFSGGGIGNLEDATNASRVTTAYALNTAGALLGVLSATFYLLVIVGVRSSSYFAAALSVICALLAWSASRQTGIDEPVSNLKGENLESSSAESMQFRISIFVLLSFLSGFGILALQVLYTRMFSLVFHNSTYTFGIVVAVFLGSLALGAWLASKFQKWWGAWRVIGVATGLGALATSMSVIVFVWQTKLKYFSFGSSFVEYMCGAMLLVTVVVAPAITCLGMMLPLVWTLAGRSGSAGRVVGRLTAVNTLAAAAGALAASFCLLTWIGLWPSVVLISVLYFFAAFVLLWNSNQKRVAVLLGLMIGVSSVFVMGSPTESKLDRIKRGERLVKRWNSPYGWIDVVQREKTGAYKIRQNLHYRFGSTGGKGREFRQAHIPLLLHPHPRDVLFMGLGTGLTAGGAVPHQDVENIVAVELIPEVVEAVRTLADHNYNVVDHPKVAIQIDDARHYLLANQRQFDVIVSDLFVPWESESGYLYTVEHYEIAAQRLKPGGLFCQWLPLYQVGTREFESIANSFVNSFPHVTLWWGQLDSTSPVIAMVGTASPWKVEANQLSIRLNDLRPNLNSSDRSIASPEALLDLYIGDWRPRPESGLNTDEHPRVEFLTPISHRNRSMIRGNQLERFFDQVLSQLPSTAVIIGVAPNESLHQRRAQQRMTLFGE